MIGFLEKMNLSEIEKKSIKLGGVAVGIRQKGDPQAVGKVLSNKPIQDESLEQALGRIWCPL